MTAARGHRLPSLAVPRALTVVSAKLDDGVSVPVRRYGNPEGPRLLISHGNGLAIDAYFPYWSLLIEGFDLMLFDLRSHGQSPPGCIAGHTIPAFSKDLEAIGQTVDRHFGVRPRVGVFHSVSCLAAALSPSLGAAYSALVLFDPPLCPAGMGIAHRILESSCSRAAARTRIRVRRFQSKREFVDLVKMQPAMTRLIPGVPELMARTTLRAHGQGGYVLRCLPEQEANILESIPRYSRLVDPDLLPLPVKVIGADPHLPHHFFPPCNLSGARFVDFESLSDTTHLAQLERPEECARVTIHFLGRLGLSGPT
ncbi:MAG: alpha/beta hydrolase [Bryobacterales bacterium]|nr:alpha/beta hydrolase [Bryobacterales bacterium]MDE0628793.1 alpha/beta hydrolase [Bryobacterales bacterium]